MQDRIFSRVCRKVSSQHPLELSTNACQQLAHEHKASAMKRFLSVQAVLRLSKEQMHDAMFLRKLYLTRRAVLNKEGRAILAQMTDTEQPSGDDPHPVLNVARVGALATSLQQIAAKEQVHHYRIVHAWFRGVRAYLT